MKQLSLVLSFIPLGFSALFPVINPIGSALLFLGLVPNVGHAAMKALARKVAFNTVWFLLIVQITGTYILRFFGISLPVMQVAGGLVLAAMGWTLLNKEDSSGSSAAPVPASIDSIRNMLFYPLTFPITAGPGTIVVALTLSVHASVPPLTNSVFAHLGLFVGTILIGIVIYFSYAYADRITAKLSPSVTHGILRVISFILLCIGGEIMWSGIQALLKTLS